MRRFPLSVWLFAFVLAAITSAPYLAADLSAPAGWMYSGAPLLPAGVQWDYNSYLSRMWHGLRGEWAYRLLFTHEPHTAIPLVNGFYMVLGAVAGLTSLSLPLTYHLARFALTIGMALALWSFASRFFEQTGERWVCLLFATIVGGWSWLLLLAPGLTAQISPIEFWLTDAFNLLGALYVTHFAAAIILQVVIVLTFDAWVWQGGGRRLVVLTLALAAESIIQPYVIALLGPLLAFLTAYHVFVTQRLTWRRVVLLLPPFGVHTALIVYQYVAMNADPVWAQFIAQNKTYSPPPSFYLLGYLPFLIPIAPAMWRLWRRGIDHIWWLPIVWVGLVAVLVYAPVSVQRRYLIGVQTPLAALAAYGWTRAILPRFSPPRRPLATIVYLALGSIAPILVIASSIVSSANPLRMKDAYYRPDERLAYAWLQRETAGHDDVVLTTFDGGHGSGGKLVAAIGQRVFMGHGFETVDLQNKIAQVRRFYDPATRDSWRRDFLKQIDAVYVWYDDYARAMGRWNPAQADYLQPVFVSDTVTLYSARHNE